MNCKFTVTFFLVCILSTFGLKGYTQYYRMNLGLQFGPNATFFGISPGDNNLKPGVAFFPDYLGLQVSTRLGEGPFFLDTELGRFPEFLRLQSIEAPVPFVANVGEIWNLRFRIKRQLPLYGNRLFFAPLAGVGIGFVPGNGSNFSSSYSTSQGSFSMNFETPILPNQITIFASIGVAFEVLFRNGMRISLRGEFNQGFRKVLEDEITYSLGNNPPTNLQLFSRGTHLPVSLGLSYPISRIWEGKIEIE